MAISLLPMADIKLDKRLQFREHMSTEAIDEYAEHLTDLPPCRVIRTPEEGYLLVAGWHRYQAHQNKGKKHIPCEVGSGSFQDALLEAVGENHDHGVRRTVEDKTRAVQALVTSPGWENKSDRLVAQQCKVSHQFVATVRAAKPKARREGADGKKYPAKKKHKKTKTTSPKAAARRDPKVEVDSHGVAIPKRCRDVYFDSWIPDTIDLLMDLSSRLWVNRLVQHMEKRKALYPSINAKDFVDGVAQAAHTMEQLAQHLGANRPTAVCPQCEGAGCAPCKNSGLVNEATYKELKAKK